MRYGTRSALAASILTLCSGLVVAQPAIQPQVIEIGQPAAEPVPRERSVPAIPVSQSPAPAVSAAVPTTLGAAPVLAPIASLNLDQCIDLGMQHQPALSAARASLSSAYAGKRGVDRLILPRLFVRDLPIRRQQACQGVTIAEAGMQQAEAETRYSITRNFFTVQYVRSQQQIVNDVIESLREGKARAEIILKAADPDNKITQFDVDFITIQIGEMRKNKAKVDNGMLKALAALREAMGVNHDFELNIDSVALPAPNYQLDKTALINSALASRPELIQANAANRLTELEIQAQYKILGWQGKTFSSSGDIHAKPIPTGIFNNEYRPGAIGPEMPSILAGRRTDRTLRASALNERSIAVVDKTQNLIALDVEAMYLKWHEAVDEIESIKSIEALARGMPKRILDRAKQMPKEATGAAIIQANTTSVLVRTQLNDALHVHALALAGLERATAGAFRIYPAPEAIAPPKK